MRGVVVLLDDANRSRVQAMAESLQHFGGTPATVGLPHVTLHAARGYDLETLKDRVTSLGRSLPPVTISSTGIGVFPGETTYVYLAVVRSPRLTVLQRAAYDEIAHLGEGSEPVWAPARWVPHITLATFDHGKGVGEAVQSLLGQETAFEFVANEISVFEGETEAAIIHSAPFNP